MAKFYRGCAILFSILAIIEGLIQNTHSLLIIVVLFIIAAEIRDLRR